MDSVTYNKLEYITSGSGLTKKELGEIVDLMEVYAKEHVTEALSKHGIMQAEGSDSAKGAAVGQRSVDTVAERGMTIKIPTAQEYIDFMEKQYNDKTDERKSSEEQT